MGIPSIVIEFFVNYDCSLDSVNLIERIVEGLCY